MRVTIRRLRQLLLVLVVLSWCAASTSASGGFEGYLEGGEAAAIGGTSIGLFGLGHVVKSVDSGHTPLIGGPLPGEVTIQRWLGGEYYQGKSNFLDSDFGSAFTPVVGGLGITIVNVAWPRDGELKDASQDLLLYTSGLLATKGITDMVKGVVGRKRPFAQLYPDLKSDADKWDYAYTHRSFFSGHSSSAFFAMTFLNKRVRETMRRESPDGYDDYKWVSSAVCFGYATYVGWSRIHAYKHYLSDVILGATAGWLLAELFYSFDEVQRSDGGASDGAGGFYLSWGFRF